MSAKSQVKLLCVISGIALCLGVASMQNSYGQNTGLPFDTPTIVSGVESVCTGVGEGGQNNPRWSTYPVKVVIAGKEGQYLGGAEVTVSQHGKTVVSVACGGPWTLFKLPPGRYEVRATIGGETQSGIVYALQSGQRQLIIRFLDLGGAVSPQYVPPMH